MCQGGGGSKRHIGVGGFITNSNKNNIILITLSVILCLVVTHGSGEVLTPPYFNLAEGRKITATATCGDVEPEMYCKLVGAQVCDFCDKNNKGKSHPPEYAVDGMETWWQSPPLSRGMKYNEVNITIDLGQVFHVAYVFVRMGNSPRPGLWALEKSSDHGKTYTPWMYFSDSASDCETYFGAESLLPITADDSVICNTEYSKIVPLEGGEIPIPLLNNRPSANKYFNSSVLQEWTKATNVRLRLLRTKTLLGHLMSVARQDPTVTRRYFYSIKDISIGGRCMCNGHAELCDIPDPDDPNKLLCRCQHHTCGPQCNYCCPGFQQKAWRQSQNWQKFHCEPCNCFNHSTECDYDPEVDAKHLSLDIYNKFEGGGVCKNCQHNTMGINCNKCKDKYFRPHGKFWNETDVCQPCNCHNHYSTGNCAEGTGQCECRKEFRKPLCDECSHGYFGYPDCKPCICFINGTDGTYCEPPDGVCPCKTNYAGIYCDQCSDGFYNFPECEECACNPVGSLTSACDQKSGNCICKNSFSGRTCEQCAPGYYNYPTCAYCNCDSSGTLASICDDTTGVCLCKEGFGGARCDQCISGYYSKLVDRERVCVPCNCSSIGSITTSCDANGKCTCLFNFAGTTCDQCSPGYFKYPQCLPCNCDQLGAIGETCDSEGQCRCKSNFDTLGCNVCKEGFYNYPVCEECNCDPAGVVQSFAGCGSVPEGELCECKERVQGRICNECKPLFYDLQQYYPLGCVECKCFTPGTLSRIGVCNTKTGQCPCKYLVGERGCSECKDGTYNLTDDNIFGCVDCNCDIGGAVNNICNKQTGECTCKPRIAGQRCDKPLQTHYIPTLYQYQYEAEDAETESGGQVRAGSLYSVFPDYSWKGYASFGVVQNQINQPVYIQKASVYRMVLRYVNPTQDPIVATTVVTPDNSNENEEQTYDVLLKPNTKPSLVTVAGAQGTTVSPFVMNPGMWFVTIKTTKILHLDYFVLIPAPYYEATILSNTVETPCAVGNDGLCLHFDYPNLSNYDSVMGGGGFTSKNGVRAPIFQYINNVQQLKELGESEIPLMNKNQQELILDLRVSRVEPHVMVIEYVTPVSKEESTPGSISLTARGSTSQEVAKVHFNTCPYTFPCRQIVTDDSNRIQVFNIQDNFVGLTLKEENGGNVAIKSVTMIPYDQWHMDYVMPRTVCVRRNSTCLQSEFPLAPDSKKVEFESSSEGIPHSRPKNIFDNKTELIHLSDEFTSIDVSSKVQSPGQYVFVVHYYQPSYPESDIETLIQNGQIYEAKLTTRHCPSNSGCRSVIKSSDGNIKFSLTENFLLTLTSDKDREVWLDYLLIVPADHYTDALLTEIKLDQSKEFISKCGNNHFHVNISVEGFCRDSVFSLTSDYNNGALPCNCDYRGSLSFECNPFGGECQCKENVIGRQCEACKTGYYGFPDCKPCGCPSTATCDKDTGQCKCANRVTGEKCDKCAPLTFAFDPETGCMECDCHPDGVVANQLQCDLINGSCSCNPNVEGRMCDHCAAGYHSFPYCDPCDCNTNGTLPDICDKHTSECSCKSNVYGKSCDLCKEGTFDLREENDAGCTKCFCFGKTTRCNSATLYWSKIDTMDDWFLVNINQNVTIEKHINPVQKLNDTTIGATLATDEAFNKVVYFAAPEAFLGRKLTSYGGVLEYTLYTYATDYDNVTSQGDIILEGADVFLIYSSIEQPSPSASWLHKLELRETNFTTVTGVPATRELLMTVLENLKGLFIKATYWDFSVSTRLQNVSLQEAVPYTDNLKNFELASSVEECACPVSYTGSSCEECAEGYYRVSTGPYGGYCVPCQCNDHATSCDVHTGICHDCQHNTQGEHCEECVEGYHGNATIGTPQDCLICACPLPLASNNFATSCEVSSDGEHITCDCKEGYFGARCESCDSGYYGRPEAIGDVCKPCECSGNINPDDPESCDTVTGRCLKCMNNTFGEACALCEPGFYGDAIISKDCQVCICDKLGMERCDSYTGTCVCKPGVVGDKCDRCKDEHWGIESGEGCSPCNCSIASHSRQCEDSTGQCKCAPGVTGKTCAKCAPGFWNYSPDGCVSCGCNSEYSVGFGCNATTGHCECLPGVIGEKCDHCPYRWVLIEEEGCFECDPCVHSLLDSTDDLKRLLDPVMVDFQNKASGYFTSQKLAYIKQLMIDSKPSVEGLDPRRFDLTVINNNINDLENDVRGLERRAEFGHSDGKKINENAIGLLNQSQAVMSDSKSSNIKVRATVSHVWELANSLETAQLPRVDNALAEAKQILSDIKDKDLTPLVNNSQTHLDAVKSMREKVEEFLMPVEEQNMKYKDANTILNKFNEIIKDANEQNKLAENKAGQAEALHEKHSKNHVNSLLDLVNYEMKKAEGEMNEAFVFLDNSSYALNDLKKAVDNAGRELNEGFHTNNQANKTIEERESQISELENLYKQAENHMNVLLNKSNELNAVLEISKNNSQTEHAVRGASAYPDIVKELKAAHQLALEAVAAAENATTLANGLGEYVAGSKSTSSQLHAKALDALQQVQANLTSNVDDASKLVETIKELLQNLTDVNSAIKASLSSFPAMSLGPFIKNATGQSQFVNETASKLKELIDGELSESLSKSVNLSRELPERLHSTVQMTKLLQQQLDAIEGNLPKMDNLERSVTEKARSFDAKKKNAKDKLEKLKRKIATAKDVANRIDIGVDFKPSTNIQLKPPDNIDELGTSTHVSLYFKTPVENSFLMYLGNLEGTKLRRTKRDDFMALEVIKGYPTLTIDLGDGPYKITHDRYVADNTWYQVIVDRVGKHIDFTIREELPDGQIVDHSKEDSLKGIHTIFNLDKKESKLFVGGYPTSYKVQDDVEFSSFDGQIEELVIGDTPVGLWNFEEAQNNNKGAKRDKLISLKPRTGYKFDGQGYAVLNANQYEFKEKSDIQFKFKTFAKDGLLFLVGKGKSFLSIEMIDGKIFFQYRLGHSVLTIEISDTYYNDGQWHTLSASRYHKEGQLIVDDQTSKNTADGDRVLLDVTGQMYFGGYPNKHNYIEVTNIGFNGCIDDVVIAGTTVDLSNNIQAFGVTPGCPTKDTRIVSFEMDGFLKRSNVSSSNNFQMSLKFKTSAKDGLIFYATNADQTAGISLSLINGTLVVLSQKTKMNTGSVVLYNDEQWHVVTTTHDDHTLSIMVDDYELGSTDSPPPPLHFMYGSLFIGGVPRNYVITPQGAATRRPFRGCIADATINGAIVDFANATEKYGATLGTCTSNADVRIFRPPYSELPITGEDGSDKESPPTRVQPPPEVARRPHVTSAPVESFPPVTEKKEESKPQGCAPYDKSVGDGDLQNGFRFGSRIDSRVEFDKLPARDTKEFDFSVEFKTSSDGGLIFYAADSQHRYFVAVYMQQGKVHYAFNCGSGVARLVSSNSYNDDQWHVLEFSRQRQAGKLIVDHELVAEGSSPGTSNIIIMQPPFYYGGVENVTTEIKNNLQNYYNSFDGCLKNLQMSGHPMMDIKTKFGTYPCSVTMEKGIYFGGNGGYLKLFRPFKVSRELRISMDIKPRTPTALLLSVHGKTDYLVVELTDNIIIARVNNKKGSYSAQYNVSDQNLCDGNWHSIEIIKSKNVLTVGLNKKYGQAGIGTDASANTSSALFIGGHSNSLSRLKGSNTRQGFAGCIKNLQINGSEFKAKAVVRHSDAYQDTHVGLCPV